MKTRAGAVRAATVRAGPVLHFRGWDDAGLHLAAIVVGPEGEDRGPLRTPDGQVAPVRIALIDGIAIWRYTFRLPRGAPGYHLDGRLHEVATDPGGDLRVAFVSCNGEETGDLERDPAERDAMWARLAEAHRQRPFGLLLQGGDQVYADEATRGHPLSEDWPRDAPDTATEAELRDLAAHLRRRFLERYLAVLVSPDYGWVGARVPSLSVWDDHDICDGWGSLPRRLTESPVGRTLFGVARAFYLLFQHAATEADVPELFLDPRGRSLGWCRVLPGLTILAPDLRSERGRRQVMGEAGWRGLEAVSPAGGHTLLVSSVPLLGPRLSILERLNTAIPRMQEYEDDLRDQWQSRAHRAEWQRALREALRLRQSGPVTVLSGEIHLAARAEMGRGASTVHQLIASGIAHRPPPGIYGRVLGWLARLGQAPLPGHPIRILPLPGQTRRYVAERNFLVLDRTAGDWTAVWHLEQSGPTPPLRLCG